MTTLYGGRDHRMTVLQRAFQLARSGHILTMGEIRDAVRREGYSTDQIEGPVLKRQLNELIRTARQTAPADLKL